MIWGSFCFQAIFLPPWSTKCCPVSPNKYPWVFGAGTEGPDFHLHRGSQFLSPTQPLCQARGGSVEGGGEGDLQIRRVICCSLFCIPSVSSGSRLGSHFLSHWEVPTVITPRIKVGREGCGMAPTAHL